MRSARSVPRGGRERGHPLRHCTLPRPNVEWRNGYRRPLDPLSPLKVRGWAPELARRGGRCHGDRAQNQRPRQKFELPSADGHSFSRAARGWMVAAEPTVRVRQLFQRHETRLGYDRIWQAPFGLVLALALNAYAAKHARRRCQMPALSSLRPVRRRRQQQGCHHGHRDRQPRKHR